MTLVLPNDNVDLRAERLNSNFAINALSAVIWDGAEKVKRRREISAYVNSHPELHSNKPILLMTREERFENASRLSVEAHKHMKHAINEAKSEEYFHFHNLVHGIDGQPFALQNVMGIPTILNSADNAQRDEWLPKMLSRQINVCYAQTEIGHGTNVKNLETIAELDTERDEFILNTPTVTATKYWPGNLGKQSTHAIVMAILLINKTSYGPHLFIVPLRDLDSYLPLPGILVGDIGPKLAYNTNDNGYLQLNNVRIPRRYMLMKHVQVTNTGKYIRPIHDKVNFTGMMFVRSVMITGMALHLASACTIAIRYSCVRRQGELTAGQGEVQVLDYQTQQHRLFPQLSRAFAFLFAGTYIRQLYFNVMNNINVGDVSLMADLHGLSSGLKSQVSYLTSLGIEQCRMACGGHGYSEASGLPLIYGNAVAGCTYEGENMVMLLQVGKYLLRRAQEVRTHDKQKREKAAQVAGPFTKYYFYQSDQKTDSQWHHPLAYLLSFEHVSQRITLLAYDRFELLKKEKNLSKELAWNETAVDWTKAARSHTRTFLARNYVEFVEKVKDSGARAILTDLLHLYLTNELIECSAGLLEDGYLSGNDLLKVREYYYDYLKRIRPQAVSIVDSFEFDDRELNSVLGRKDGNVYENLLKWSQSSSLNKTEVPEFHKKYVGAAMRKAREASKI